jgi:hypothetical protein
MNDLGSGCLHQGAKEPSNKKDDVKGTAVVVGQKEGDLFSNEEVGQTTEMQESQKNPVSKEGRRVNQRLKEYTHTETRGYIAYI